jgi:hypothetical protein
MKKASFKRCLLLFFIYVYFIELSGTAT